MSQVTVSLQHLRTAPRKVRQVIDVVRNLSAEVAMQQLTAMPQRAAHPVRKLLVSGLHAARSHGLAEDHLKITSIICDQGPALKRRRLNSRGRASMVKKFTSHIALTLSDQSPQKASTRK